MENLQLYHATRAVTENALKKITGGRLTGMSDINPMWRIKTLTEQFGPCGIGWKYVIKEKRLESAPTGEIAAFLDIDLFYMWEDKWSEAIPGTGGSAFVTNESKGAYVSDECFKMALTDAISVACKALGIGADVYWQNDKSKYDNKSDAPLKSQEQTILCEDCGQAIQAIGKYSIRQFAQGTKKAHGKQLCNECNKKANELKRRQVSQENKGGTVHE